MSPADVWLPDLDLLTGCLMVNLPPGLNLVNLWRNGGRTGIVPVSVFSFLGETYKTGFPDRMADYERSGTGREQRNKAM